MEPSAITAAVVDIPGAAEELSIRQLPAPEPESDDILVDVVASGVNPVDIGNRTDPGWAGIDAPYVVGYEFAGTVQRAAAGLPEGCAVWGALPVRGTRWGALATRIAVPRRFVAPRPSALTTAEAAGMPLAGITALQALQRVRLEAGSWLYLHGATGGVGHLLLQMAVRRGIRVASASRPADRARLEGLGLDLWLDRAGVDPVAEAVGELGGELDAVIDTVGGMALASMRGIRPGGHYATIVDLSGDLDEALDRNLDLHGVLARPGPQALDDLAREVEAGVRPVIAAQYPFAQVAQAHRRVEAGGVGGKVVVVHA